MKLPKGFDTEAEQLAINYALIALEKIHPNTWNPNAMTENAVEALGESMDEYNDFDPIVVRPHPTLEGEFEIVDGEHRWKTRTSKGLKFALCNILELDDNAAQKLTVVTLEDRGAPDKIKLAQLLAKLDEAGADLETSLPYTDEELQELIKMGQHDWEEDYGDDSNSSGGDTKPPAGEWVTLTITMSTEDHQAFLDCYKRISQIDDLNKTLAIANGQVVAALSAEYLASNAEESETEP